MAKSVLPTVAKPPMIPEESFNVLVVIPLLALCVPVGRVKLTVLPKLRVMVPVFSTSGLAVALAVSVIAELPLLRLKPLTVWLFVVEVLPVRSRVPPPSARVEALAMILEVGAMAVEKSKANVPVLTVVVPE